MYYITIIRNGDYSKEILERESNYSCSEYHYYPTNDNGKDFIELCDYRFGGSGGAITKTVSINRNNESAFIMNINGKTLRSIPMFTKDARDNKQE